MKAHHLLSLVAVLSLAATPLRADDWRADMERKIDLLTKELESRQLGEVAAPVYQSVNGLSPAASKVYHINHGVSVGGYGEMVLRDFDGQRDNGTASGAKRELDFLRAILYVGHKFSDKVLLNTELEFEHGSTAGGAAARGEVSVEFAYLDFQLAKPLGVRTGMLLVPMGFINELHEPTVYHGALRPNVENQIIPTTWRENGVGLFGDWGDWSYRAYLVAGLQGVDESTTSTAGLNGFSAGSALRNARSKGARSQAEDFATTARLDYNGVPGTVIGASIYSGDSGQAQTDANGKIAGTVNLWETHVGTEWGGFEVRTLFAQGRIGDAERLNAKNALTGTNSIGERFFGGYAEAAFDILSLVGSQQSLAPFFRYERYDTQQEVPTGFSKNNANSRVEYTVGLTYKPHPNTVFKLDWQNMNNQAGTGVDQTNMAVGYMF